MKTLYKKSTLLLALALLLSLLGACGDGAASSAANISAPAPSEETAAPTAEAPQPTADSAEVLSAQEPADETPEVPGGHKSIADVAPDIPM